MNTNSVLCRFLAEHPHNWQALLEADFGIRIKFHAPYAIFNYSHTSNFADPIVQEARGIILDTETLDVVCWPFRKFGNHTESYADPIDWSSARVLEKVDGSIIKLWYDRRAEQWQFSTNGMIRAEEAPLAETVRGYFGDLIRSACNYSAVPFDTLDKTCTYIFELVSPQTQVVVLYGATTLYHLGTRSNITGEEFDTDIGICKPAAYPISSLRQCIDAAIALNRGNTVTAEGFVVVDSHWNRVKVKSPEYLIQHTLTQKKTVTRQECIQLLMAGSADLDTICQANPNLIPAVKFYEYHFTRLCHLADRLGNMARSLYEEYSHDRAAVARIIGRHPLSYVGFHCIGNNRPGREVLMHLAPDRICRLIPEYEEEDLTWLFRD